MANNIPDGRSPIAVAMYWASQVTTICIQMVLPIVLGVWADRRLGSKFVITLFGAGIGLWLGLWSLIRLGKRIEESERMGGEISESMTDAENNRKSGGDKDEIRTRE